MSWAIKDKGYTQRRACRLAGLEPKTYRYATKRSDDRALRQRLKELASERRRFGYRRLHLLLRREGVVLNWKKLYRLYREERLTVCKRGGRRRALGTRGTDDDPARAQSAVVAGLRLRHPCLGPQVPDADRGR